MLSGSLFLQSVMHGAVQRKLVSSIKRHHYSLPDDLISDGKCQEVEKRTQSQSKNALWHELRYGRITESETEGGSLSLVRECTGVSKVFKTQAMQRPRSLEEKVVVEVKKKLNIKLH